MHSLLKRQLKRHFASRPIPEGIEEFLAAVDAAYREADSDRLTLERSLDLSSRELVQANAELRALLGAFPDLCFHLDRDGTILDCKGGDAGDFVLTRAELIGRRFQDVPVGDVRSTFQDALATVAQSQAPVSFEYALTLPGGPMHFEARLLPVLDGRYMAIVRNITERRRAEDERRTTQELLDAIIQGLPFPQFVLDRDHRILYWNRALEEQSGIEAAAIVGTRDHWKAFYPTCRPCLADVVIEGDEQALERWYKGKYWKSKLVAGAYEAMDFIPRVRQTGRWLHFGVIAIRDSRGVVVGAVESLDDVTELVETQESLSRAQDQLRQSQKMEAVGRLAGGVAHDFNNLLTAIRGHCDIAQARWDNKSCLRYSIQQICQATDRAAALTRQLLAFSRQQVLQPKLLDLNCAVINMDALLRRLIGENIELVTELDPQLRLVMADPGQIEQVVMNLAVNARDALADGGLIVIRTANVPPDSEASRNRAPRPGAPAVMLSVTDTGCGMDEQTRACVFDPFFTTKALGKGTGLGLATVHGIVEQSGGRIWVDSEPGKGTTFEIYLPDAAGRFGLDDSERATHDLARGRETILLVEDEDVVRDVAREMLAIAGYTVRVARNGNEALQVLEEHGDAIDLVMTDLVMPGMGGRELGELVRARHPAARILFTSGHTSDAAFHDGTMGIGCKFLQKPFSVESLASKVREVLDEPREPAPGPRPEWSPPGATTKS